jgi:hypothetical protein
MSSGKWYWEVTLTTSSNPRVGVYNIAAANPADLGGTANGWCLLNSPSRTFNSGSAPAYGDFAGNNGDVVMVAYNADTGKIWYGVNGRFFASGNPATGDNASQSSVTGNGIVPAVASGTGSNVFDCNFGQKPFKFPPPAGFQPLALANTPRPSIVRPDQYVGVTTYVGTSGATSVSNLQFKPDLVWLKNRDSGDGWHQWRDSVRGGDKNLASNSTAAESDASTKNLIFNSNGFTLTGTTDSRDDNYDGDDYVAWAWKAGGNSNTYNIDDVGYATAEAAGLTAGTITPTGASVNTKSGFSIVRFTGPGSAGFQSVPHGLGKTPKFIICKDLDNSRNWGVYHPNAVLDDNDVLILNSTSAVFSSGTNTWDISEINSSIFTPYFRDDFGASYGADNIAYCWAEIPGFSKFGRYTGNNSADGTAIITGFKPALVIWKRVTGGTGNWVISDRLRDSTNPIFGYLTAESSAVEERGTAILDFLSNGFKIRNTWVSINGTDTIIYAAFAETPSFNLYGGQANAR